MAKPNKAHHERCIKYKNRGQREINKKKKQERDKKRIAHFARRKAEGKCYEYQPMSPKPEKEGRDLNAWEEMRRERYEKVKPYKNKTHWQKWRSIMRKVQNEIDEELMLEKRKESEDKNNKEKNKK